MAEAGAQSQQLCRLDGRRQERLLGRRTRLDGDRHCGVRGGSVERVGPQQLRGAMHVLLAERQVHASGWQHERKVVAGAPHRHRRRHQVRQNVVVSRDGQVRLYLQVDLHPEAIQPRANSDGPVGPA